MSESRNQIFFYLYNSQLTNEINPLFKGFGVHVSYYDGQQPLKDPADLKGGAVVLEMARDRLEWIETLMALSANRTSAMVFLYSPPGFQSEIPLKLDAALSVFPVRDLKQIKARLAPSEMKGPSPQKKVLFVDDDNMILKAYRRFFKKASWEFVIATSGEAALDILDREDIDLVVTDIKMPQMHGVELISKIRDKNRDIPIYACSAYPGMKEDDHLNFHQISDFIEKPVDIEKLKQKIDDLLA